MGTIRLSDYCRNDDSFPDLDRFCNDISSRDLPSMVLGTSEYSELTSDRSILNRIKDLTVQTKILVICRFAGRFIEEICDYDKKFAERHIFDYGHDKFPRIVYTCDELNKSDKYVLIHGFKNLLKTMEVKKEPHKSYCAITRLEIPSCEKVGYYKLCNVGDVCENILTADQWRQYYQDPELEGVSYNHWRFFLKIKMYGTSNAFLKMVANSSHNYPDYCRRLIFSILDYDYQSPNYWNLYNKRKEIIKKLDVSPEDRSKYLGEVHSKLKDEIYYLTDCSELERNLIIKWIVDNKCLPEHLGLIYPALSQYLSKYNFRCKYGDRFTTYFDAYRHCKILNDPSADFISSVEMLATSTSHPYDSLDYRESIINKNRNEDTHLIWVDALGVEFLSYIQHLINQYNLNSETNICRAYLPSITEYNCQFYDDWQYSKEKVIILDNLLHDGSSDLTLDGLKYPYHLPTELIIIDEVLSKIASLLNQGEYRKVILTSDHGASRFARIHDGRTVSMPKHGKKSGRCCEVSHGDFHIPTAILENDHYSMSNYDRFQFGNKQGVELHGGATLEEILVPVIILSSKDESIKFNLKTPSVTYDFDKGFELIVSTNTKFSKIYAMISEKEYKVTIQDYEIKVKVDDIKRTGEYVLQLYDGDSLLVSLPFETNGRSAKFNKMDDSWFN